MEFIDILLDLKSEKGAVPGSYSRVTKIFDCPQSWYWTYREKPFTYKPKMSDDALVGKVAHSIAQVFMENGIKTKFDPRTSYTQVFNLVCIDSNYSSTITDRVIKLSQNIKAVMLKLYDSLREKEVSVSPEYRIHIDPTGHLVTPRGYRKHDLWTGIMDLQIVTKNGVATIIDYKSHSSTMEVLTESEKKQLRTYALMSMLNNQDVNKVKICLAYFGDCHIKQVATYTREDLDTLISEFTEFLTQYRDRIKLGVFDPVINTKCCWCGYQQLCPIYK